MVACGPFTEKNELSYEALKDVMAKVSEDQPHVLILCGPFVSQNNSEVSSGDIRYRDAKTGKLEFMDYEQLTQHIFNYVHSQLGDAIT